MTDNPLDGIDINKDVINRPITHEDIYYLLMRYSHLHVCDPNEAYIDYTVPAEKKRLANGWTILDHGKLIRTTAPGLSMDGYNAIICDLHGHVLPPKEDDDASGSTSVGGFTGGQGTLVWQMVMAAQAVATLAMERWEGMHILTGFYGMKRALWIALKSFGRNMGKEIKLSGFEPRDEDWVVYHYVQDLCGGAKPMVSATPSP